MVKRSLYVIIVLTLLSPSIYAKTKKEYLKEFYKTCFETAKERNLLGKSQEICQCVTNNFRYLVESKKDMEIFIKLYKTKDNHDVPDGLLDMDDSVANNCNKDSNYLSEKAQAIKKSLKEKKKDGKKPKSKKAAS